MSIKYEVPSYAAAEQCRGSTCTANIYWVRTAAGKWMPCDKDGTPHWETCPDFKEFSHKRLADGETEG